MRSGYPFFEKSRWGWSHSNHSWTNNLLWIGSDKTSLLMIPYAVYIFTYSILSFTWIAKARWKRFVFILCFPPVKVSCFLILLSNSQVLSYSETAGNFHLLFLWQRKCKLIQPLNTCSSSYAKSQYRGEEVSENQFCSLLCFSLMLFQAWIKLRFSRLKLRTSLWRSSDKCWSRAKLKFTHLVYG